MRQELLVELYRSLGSRKTGVRGKWVLGHCPLGPWNHNGKDAHPSFGIKVHPSKSICKCLSCGFGGDLGDLFMEVSRLLPKDGLPKYDLERALQLIAMEEDEDPLDFLEVPEYSEIQHAGDTPFPESWLGTFHSFEMFQGATKYLADRNVSVTMGRYMDLRFDPMDRRICFPFRNFSGQLVGVQGRAINADNGLRYKQYKYLGKVNPLAWMGEERIDLDKPVVLVEGPFDFVSVMRVYQNVLASFTTGMSREKVERIADASEIVTLYDYGSGGNAARKAVRKYLPTSLIFDVIPPSAERDPGDMTENKIRELLTPHITPQLPWA